MPEFNVRIVFLSKILDAEVRCVKGYHPAVWMLRQSQDVSFRLVDMVETYRCLRICGSVSGLLAVLDSVIGTKPLLDPGL